MSNTVYEIIRDTVNEMDYMDLLACHAPSDEFDDEIKLIFENLDTDSTVDEMAELIAQVFNTSFNASDKPELFWEYACRIKERLDNINL